MWSYQIDEIAFLILCPETSLSRRAEGAVDFALATKIRLIDEEQQAAQR